eukprot:m.26611 g.26611  ORF g.26611 m.26611 type:complete len:230 (+) comp7812_c0_seq1:76-765(+)
MNGTDEDEFLSSPEVISWLDHVETTCMGGDSEARCLVTGGASGADKCWLDNARRSGLNVCVWSFHEHNMCGVNPSDHSITLNKLTDDEKKKSDKVLKDIARGSGKDYVRNLLRRNAMIAQDCSVLYAVGHFLKQGKGTRVAGGTGCSVEIFARSQMSNKRIGLPSNKQQALELYFYSLDDKKWFQCFSRSATFLWKPCIPPAPQGRFAGVGTRKLTPHGEEAIKALFLP